MSENTNTDYQMSARERIENYWYHYKWHTLITLFFVVVFTICTVQMCQRDSYDVYVMYAGAGELRRTSEGGDIPAYQKALSSIARYADDYDENGSTSVSLAALFLPSDEDIAAIKAQGKEVNYGLIYENSGILSDNMLHSDYYLCFLSEEIFLQYCAKEVEVFDNIGAYTATDGEYEYANEYGIYLSSLDIYNRDGIKDLPENTVVCIRKLGAVTTRFDSASKRAHENAVKLLTELLK